MAEERDIEHDNDELVSRLNEAGKTAVKVAATTVIASSLAGALAEPPHTEMMSLPEPVPIVQQYQAFDDDVVPDDDEDEDANENKWRRLLRLLRYLLVTLALVGSIALGVLKGCTGLLTVPLAPHDEEQQEQTTHQTQTEDERGVAVAS